MLADLFFRLNNYNCSVVNFSEPDFRSFGQIKCLYKLEFSEGGLLLKEIIESHYTDGIDSLEDVEIDGETATGYFTDIISPTLVKRFKFKVTKEKVTYSAINTEELLAAKENDFSEWLDFGGQPRPRNCTPSSLQCGGACLPIQTPSGGTTECQNNNSASVGAKVGELFNKWKDVASSPEGIAKAAGSVGGIVGNAVGGTLGKSAGTAAAKFVAKKATGQTTDIQSEIKEALPSLSGSIIGETLGHMVGGKVGGLIGGLIGSVASEGIKQVSEVRMSKKSELENEQVYKDANKLQKLIQLGRATAAGVQGKAKESTKGGAVSWAVGSITSAITGNDTLGDIASDYLPDEIKKRKGNP